MKEAKKRKNLSGIGACIATVTQNGKNTQSVSYSVFNKKIWMQKNIVVLKEAIGRLKIACNGYWILCFEKIKAEYVLEIQLKM